ncbi:MAG: glycine cleavage system protein GcvH [Bacteroidales bacterium]|jgi:glycine cleavage system H protein|nr:glycine cleavage system protein GcvH [Bacteroidales bacterium]HHV40373.1 glycine cleavage system protein GcvH [Bacteroidales bacterium]
MNFPENLKYSKEHEWIKVEGDLAVIGITDFAQDQLGDIVFVDIETVDETLDRDEVFGALEAVKTVADLFMPLSGTIEELNPLLEDEPQKINEDPYGEGWIIKVRISDSAEIDDLLDAADYQDLIAE